MASSRMFKFVGLRLRPQTTDFAAAAATAAGWGVAGIAGAIWLVQPFDWLKKQLFEKPGPEQ